MDDLDTIRDWYMTWGGHVAAVDFAAARPLFSPDVFAFGTVARTMRGLDRLEAEQWRQVWPTIRDFRFLTDTLEAAVSPDRLQAVAACAWSSTGIAEDGSTFDRPGRATVGLARLATSAAWRGIHTHFSLAPGVPPRSYG